MQVHRAKVDLFSGPYVKGVSAPSRTRYVVNLQRAERLRGWARKAVDYLLVIVTHSCRSYLPITSIASAILDTSQGRFPPIIPQRDAIHHNGSNWPKKRRRSDALSSCTSGSIKLLACLQRYRCFKPPFYSLNLREGSTKTFRQDSIRVRAWESSCKVKLQVLPAEEEKQAT